MKPSLRTESDEKRARKPEGSGRQLTHLDARGRAKMVDVSGKPVQTREAVAIGSVKLQPATLLLIKSNRIAKGDVLNTARLAGIQAAKRTGELIPLCHPLNLSHVDVDLRFEPGRINITARAKIAAQTGVEMEALTAVAVAALTIYDMCKAVDRNMVIGRIRLVSKTKR
jgi:cyclic pyranopterin phosphate synthase